MKFHPLAFALFPSVHRPRAFLWQSYDALLQALGFVTQLSITASDLWFVVMAINLATVTSAFKVGQNPTLSREGSATFPLFPAHLFSIYLSTSLATFHWISARCYETHFCRTRVTSCFIYQLCGVSRSPPQYFWLFRNRPVKIISISVG